MTTTERAVYMLRVAKRFLEEHPITQEYDIHYDEADCDGACLADDCGYAADDLENLIK